MSNEDDNLTWEELDMVRYFLVESKLEFTELVAVFGHDEDAVDEILRKLWVAMDRVL